MATRAVSGFDTRTRSGGEDLQPDIARLGVKPQHVLTGLMIRGAVETVAGLEGTPMNPSWCPV